MNCCIYCFVLESGRVRQIPQEVHVDVLNAKSEGLWSKGALLNLKHGGYRLVNHTQVRKYHPKVPLSLSHPNGRVRFTSLLLPFLIEHQPEHGRHQSKNYPSKTLTKQFANFCIAKFALQI